MDAIDRAMSEVSEKLPPMMAVLVRNQFTAWLIDGRLEDRFTSELASEVLRMEPATVRGECPFTLSHTRHWCGHPECRES